MPSDAPTPPTSRTAAQVCPVCQRPQWRDGGLPDQHTDEEEDRFCARGARGDGVYFEDARDCYRIGYSRLHVALREVFLEGGFLTSNPRASRVSMRDIAEAALGPDCGHNNPAEQERAKVAGQGDAAGRDALVTVGSLAVMLGWVNVPPREVLERSLNAPKARAALAAEQQPPAPAPEDKTGPEILAATSPAKEVFVPAPVAGQVADPKTLFLQAVELLPKVKGSQTANVSAQAIADALGRSYADGWNACLAEQSAAPVASEAGLRDTLKRCKDWFQYGRVAEPGAMIDLIDAALASTPAGQPDDEVLRAAFDSGWLAADARHEPQAVPPAGPAPAEGARGDDAADLLALRQQVEDTVGAAQTESSADGWIIAYHFKTGAIHRLLAMARDIRIGQPQPFRTTMPPGPQPNNPVGERADSELGGGSPAGAAPASPPAPPPAAQPTGEQPATGQEPPK